MTGWFFVEGFKHFTAGQEITIKSVMDRTISINSGLPNPYPKALDALDNATGGVAVKFELLEGKLDIFSENKWKVVEVFNAARQILAFTHRVLQYTTNRDTDVMGTYIRWLEEFNSSGYFRNSNEWKDAGIYAELIARADAWSYVNAERSYYEESFRRWNIFNYWLEESLAK